MRLTPPTRSPKVPRGREDGSWPSIWQPRQSVWDQRAVLPFPVEGTAASASHESPLISPARDQGLQGSGCQTSVYKESSGVGGGVLAEHADSRVPSAEILIQQVLNERTLATPFPPGDLNAGGG